MLKRPIVSEKSMLLAKNGFYSFEIESFATKQQIAKLVKDQFKVDVVSVKTISIQGKKRQQKNRRGFYRKAGLKKAIIEVAKGQKIALFETIMNPSKEAKVTTADEPTVKEKKSLLKGTKVKIEKTSKKGEKLAS